MEKRLVDADSPPTAGQVRQGFAQNVARMLDLLHVDRKQAAGTLGVPYKWLWRMATKGITRTDDRHRGNLQKVADYFLVLDLEEFWEPGLLYRLITSDKGQEFRRRFAENVRHLYEQEAGKLAEVDQQLVEAARKAPDIVIVVGRSRRASEASELSKKEKLEALYATGRYEPLRMMAEGLDRIIDDSYQKEFGKREAKEMGAG